MMISFCFRTVPQLLLFTCILSACNSVPDANCDVVLDDEVTAPSRSGGDLQQLIVSIDDEQQALEAALGQVMLTEGDASVFRAWSMGEQAVAKVIESAEVEHVVWGGLQLAESEHLESILSLCAECSVVNDQGWMGAIANLSAQSGWSELDALYSVARALEQDWLDKTELDMPALEQLQLLIAASRVATASHLTLLVSLIEASGAAYAPVLLGVDEYQLVLSYH